MAEIYADITTELGAFGRARNQEVRAMLYQQSQLAQYTRPVYGVNGRFPALNSVLGNVIRRFASTWEGSGTTEFMVNDLRNYRMKVNHAIKPADVKETWIGETLYDEKLQAPEQPLAAYIMYKELMPAVVRDVERAMGFGDVTSADQVLQVMDGLVTILTRGITTGEMFKVPVTGPITVSNALDTVQTFEDTLDEVPQAADAIDRIFMSAINKRKMLRDDKATNGKDTDFQKDGRKYTYEGNREIVGLRCLNGSDLIFATPNENFLRLIDSVDASTPIIQKVQELDYDVKIFMEFWLGLAFWTDQLVFVSNFGSAVKGLSTAAQDIKYFQKSFK
jgi:hypothetical protein